MFPPPDDSMYDTVVRMLVTGFVTDTQLKMLKAAAAAILFSGVSTKIIKRYEHSNDKTKIRKKKRYDVLMNVR